ncbi:MAG TPA: hypothetical protein VLN59_16900, partial [Burkholderiales bacterium]|nr:hypothetical protein [Burkholderiales bacterium]
MPHDEDRDDILARANALLARHRNAMDRPTEADRPAHADYALGGGVPASDDDVPLLTDVVLPVESVQPSQEPAEESAPQVDPLSEPATHSAELISRVQSQNLEHRVYQKLRATIDRQITQVMKERFMPEIGSALDTALQKITQDLKASINTMVRDSIDQSLHAKLKDLRSTVEDNEGDTSDANAVSGIMPPFSAAPATSTMELAKSFEPAAIEARWYPVWERNGYFRAGLERSNPRNYCILLPPPNVTGT